MRKKIAPAVSRLRSYITKTNSLLPKDLTEEVAAGLRHERALMKATIKLIDTENDKWSVLIRERPTPESIHEQNTYDNFLSEDKHFSEWVDNAHELITMIDLSLGKDSDGYPNGANGSIASQNLSENMLNIGQPQIPIKSAANMRLPKLELPHFNGNPMSWPTFWQSFQPTIHDQNIPKIQKMTYLISCLSNTALQAISGYSITNENYNVVIDVLKSRFGDTKAISESLQKELINLPQASESTHSLRVTLLNQLIAYVVN